MFFKNLSKKVVSHNRVKLITKKISKFTTKLRLNLLSSRICLLFVLFLLVFLSIGEKVAINYKKKSLEKEIQKRGEMLSEIFAPWCVKALETKDDIFLLGLLNSLKQQGVVYDVIIDEEGKVIGHTDVYRLGKIYNDDITKKALQTNKFLIQSYEKSGKGFYDFGVPLLSLAEKIGVLRFGLSKDELVENLGKFATKMKYLMWAMVIMFSGGVFVLVHYNVSRPLGKIKESVKLLGGQYLEYKIHTEDKSEIGEISKGIETFINQIKKELRFQEEKVKKYSLMEIERLEKILNTILEKANKRVIVADANNSIIFSNINGRMFSPGQREKIVGIHLLDVIKEGEFVTLLNNAFAKKGEVIKGTIDFSGKKMVSILSIANEEQRGPKTIIVFENVDKC